MNASFQLTTQAADDLDEILWFVAKASEEAAERLEAEIVATFRRLATYPLIGHSRRDITTLPVRFWTLPKYSNYVVVYRPDTKPLQVIAVLHGKRNAKEVLKERFI